MSSKSIQVKAFYESKPARDYSFSLYSSGYGNEVEVRLQLTQYSGLFGKMISAFDNTTLSNSMLNKMRSELER